jgi:glycosyltransferase involved in cell wall biosynthesis
MVYKPGKLVPKLYKPELLARFLAKVRLNQAKKLLMNRGCRKVVLYLWRPEYAEALDLVSHDLSCYHIDDEYSFSSVEQPLSESEGALISRVNQVFVHSRALLKKKGYLNHRTLLVPNGVDYQAYATAQSEPEDMKKIPHPRIGYVGVIKRELNIKLLLSLARRHPEWSFVMVGPRGRVTERDGQSIDELKGMPNVWFLGSKPVDTLSAYTQHMDACILNYEVNDYTKYIYPLKLHEYLATGRPVVGAPINSLLDLSQVVALASDTDEWSHAITEALNVQNDTDEKRKARQEVARKHDWNTLVYNIASTICDQLGPE